MNDFLALALQSASFVQDLKSGLRAQPRHACGQPQLVLGGRFHSGKIRHYKPPRRDEPPV
jgi:hypothetical protein